jgi:hypothetical protein
MATKYTKWPKNRPKGHKIYQNLPLQEPPKFTQIGILGLKISHLATLWLTAALHDAGSQIRYRLVHGYKT